MNKPMRKGSDFERKIVNNALSLGLKAHRNRVSRAIPGESWDVEIAGKRLEAKKRKAGFKKLTEWIQGNDGVVVGADREQPLVVVRLQDYLKML